MHRRDLILGLSAVALVACTPPQPEQTPEEQRAIPDPAAVVRSLYDRYMTEGAQFPPLEDQAPWSNATRALLLAMMQRSQQINEPILDFDPIIAAQDYQLSNLNVVTEAVVEGSHASARATFDNSGTRTEVVYDLVWEDDRWKVDNIRGEGWDLRQIATAPTADVVAQ